MGFIARFLAWLNSATPERLPPPTKDTTRTPRAPKSTSTRAKASSGATAFRLAHELEGLLDGIAADHVIVDDETRRLRQWLAGADTFRRVEPFKDVATHVEKALSDGVLTLEECEDILFALRNLTTVNPHFDQLRGGVQQLLGLMAGVAADKRITAHEAQRLRSWQHEWSHLTGLWPFDECHELVERLFRSEDWTDDARRLLEFADQFPVTGSSAPGRNPPLTLKGVCAERPAFYFDGHEYVFTGDSLKCERSELERIVRDRGGRPHPRVTLKTNFLVVCDGGSEYWAYACYGRKIERAYQLRQEGRPIVIARERDFWNSVN